MVDVLQQGRPDQLTFTGEDSSPLRTLNGFAGAESDEVGALSDEAPQIVDGWKLGRRIHQHRHAGLVGHFGHCTQRRTGMRLGNIKDTGGALVDCIGNFPRLGVPDPGAGKSVGNSYFD